jgi:DNA-binding response OmpR family regulator
MEFLLLKALVTCQGRVATRGWLLDQINADAEINERTVDYHICTLRIKLRKARLPEGIIASVRGVGYRYSAAPAALTGLST